MANCFKIRVLGVTLLIAGCLPTYLTHAPGSLHPANSEETSAVMYPPSTVLDPLLPSTDKRAKNPKKEPIRAAN